MTSCNLIILYFNDRKQIVNDHENAFILLEMDWSQVIGLASGRSRIKFINEKKNTLNNQRKRRP